MSPCGWEEAYASSNGQGSSGHSSLEHSCFPPLDWPPKFPVLLPQPPACQDNIYMPLYSATTHFPECPCIYMKNWIESCSWWAHRPGFEYLIPSWYFWEGSGGVASLEEVCHWAKLWIFKRLMPFLMCCLSPAFLPAVAPATSYLLPPPSWTRPLWNRKSKINSALGCLGLLISVEKYYKSESRWR